MEGAREAGAADGGAVGASIRLWRYLDARWALYRLAGRPMGVQVGLLQVSGGGLPEEL